MATGTGAWTEDSAPHLDSTAMNDASRPLLGPRSVSSGSSAAGSQRVRVHRWRNLNVPQYYENFYNSLLQYAPARVVAFGGAALLLGVVVLVHTQNLVTTAGMPRASLRSTNPSILPPVLADATNCSELWMEQRIDHFSWLGAEAVDEDENVDVNGTPSGLPATYQQRYLLNDQFWDPSDKRAPVFFYTGNEGDVTLYANHTGLMWENAREFKALIVFAEHRYYGKSFPFGDKYMDHLAYLTHDQALADFTTLIYHLQGQYDAFDHPVIAFGGSYGGKLSAWIRMKYPDVITGAIAASAPIYGFGGYPAFKDESYWQVVTRDATPAAGSAKNCVPNVKKSWPQIFALAKTESGRATLSEIFKLCEPLTTEAQGEDLAMSVLFAFDNLAMGDFPYPSSYISGSVDLPPWPVREACSHLAGEFPDLKEGEEETDVSLLEALRDAANVYHNASQELTCFKIPTLWDYDGIWDYQYCTEMLPQETYFNTNGETDMFWPRNVTLEDITAHCQAEWHVTPDPEWTRVSYGDAELRGASNIVFSNGLLDPWSSAGVLQTPKDAKVTLVEISEGAHHLDLFFSNPEDPPSVIAARKEELRMIRKWIDEFVAYK